MKKEGNYFCKKCLENIENGTLDRLYYCEDPLCDKDDLQDLSYENLCDYLQVDRTDNPNNKTPSSNYLQQEYSKE